MNPALSLGALPRLQNERFASLVPHVEFTGKQISVGLNPYSNAPVSLPSVLMKLADQENVTRPYAQSPVVYACAKATVRALVSVPWRLWASDDQDAEEVPASDRLRTLLVKPNGIMGGKKLWRLTVLGLLLAGGDFWLMTDQGGNPIAPGEMPECLWPAKEDLVEAYVDREGVMQGWRLRIAGKERIFPTHAVAHLYDPDPDNPLRGIGPMQPAYRRVNTAFRCEAFDDGILSNGGQMGGILEHENRSLTADQRKTLEESFLDRFKRPWKNRGIGIIPGGLKYKQAAFSPVDMDLAGMRTWARDETMMAFGATKPLIGVTDDVNRGTAREARRVFFENTIAPLCELLADELQEELFTKLPPPFNRYTIGFDWRRHPAMREELDSQIERVVKLQGIGRTWREATTLVGWDIAYERMQNVDLPWIGTTLQTVENAQRNPVGNSAPQPKVHREADGAAGAASADDRAAKRRKRADDFDKSLRGHDNKIARGIHRVFRDFILVQRKRLREFAERKDLNGHAHDRVVWNEWGHERVNSWPAWMAEWAHAYGDLPERKWYEVRGVSREEIDQLLVQNLEKWREELWHATGPTLLRVVQDGINDMADLVGMSPAVSVQDPAILQLLASREILIREGPMTVLAEQVRGALVRGFAESTSMGTLAERVREVLEELEDELKVLADRIGTRAMMIARTETAIASNTAQAEQVRASGVAQIEWASSRDEFVRRSPVSHRIDGEVTLIGQSFSNGMRWPGDPLSPPSAHINERCTFLPVLSEQ